MELRRERPAASERPYLDYEYWTQAKGVAEDIAGIVVYDDRR
jgi:hypothetical protein